MQHLLHLLPVVDDRDQRVLEPGRVQERLRHGVDEARIARPARTVLEVKSQGKKAYDPSPADVYACLMQLRASA